MKRFIALFACLMIIAMAFNGCATKEEKDRITPIPTQAGSTKADDKNKATSVPQTKVINVWSYNNEVTMAIKKYEELNPNSGYDFYFVEFSTIDGDYQTALDLALATGGSDAPDIYSTENTYTLKYTQGKACSYAASYQSLGIDVDSLLKEADISQYLIDIGTNPDGELVGLGCQSTAGALIYRRSIAKEVWGTDDPSIIKGTIGPGWDTFMKAAKDLKAKGYGICSSTSDIWPMVANSADKGWVTDGKLTIDPKRKAFFDLALELKKNNYTNDTRQWSDEWYNDIKDAGKKKIFGYFGPAWLLNYIFPENCGGKKVGEGTYGDWAVCEPPIGFYLLGTTVLANKDSKVKEDVGKLIKWMIFDTSETGLQYLWANGQLQDGVKDAVSSAAVMKKSNGVLDLIGGQNFCDIYLSSAKKVNGNNVTEYDSSIDSYWLSQVQEYTAGNKSKTQAIKDFKKQVADNLPITVD